MRTAIARFCFFVCSFALMQMAAAAPLMTSLTWHPMAVNNVAEEGDAREGQASVKTNVSVLSTDSVPFWFDNDTLITLEQDHYIQLPAHRWLYLGGNWLEVNTVVFDAPHLGVSTRVSSDFPFIMPAHHNRVIKLPAQPLLPQNSLQHSSQGLPQNSLPNSQQGERHNDSNDSPNINVFLGRTRDIRMTPPLVALSPKNSREVRVASSVNNEYHDHVQGEVSLDVEEDQYYLLSSLFEQDTLTATRRFEMKTGQLGDKTLYITQREDASNRYQLSAEGLAYLRTESPHIIHAKHKATLTYSPSSDELNQIHALNQGWLFEKNFTRYELPVIQALQTQQTQQTQQAPEREEVDVRKFSFKSIRNVEMPSGEAQRWHHVNTQPKVWRFSEDIPHFISPNIITGNNAQQKRAFVALQPGQVARFPFPHQAVANVVRLQVAAHPLQQAKLTLTSSAGEQTLWQLNPTSALHNRIANHAWESQAGNALSKDTAQSPPLWQMQADTHYTQPLTHLELKATGSEPVLVRLQYPVMRTLKMDEPQWLQLFNEQKGWQQWSNHDATQALTAYLASRKASFAEGRRHEFWRSFLTSSQRLTANSTAGLKAEEKAARQVQKQHQQIEDLSNMGVMSLVRTLLSQPKINEFTYWQRLSLAMKNEGLHSYKRAMWQMLVLHHPSLAVREHAFIWLETEYRTNKNMMGLEQLYSVAFLQGKTHGLPLAKILFHKGEFEQALMLLSEVVTAKSKPQAVETDAAFIQKTHREANALIAQAATALGLFNLADMAKMQHGLTSLSQADDNPQQADGQPPQETSGVDLVRAPFLGLKQVESAGVVNRYNPELAVQSTWFKGAANAPVRITTDAPMFLQLEARPWFQRAGASAVTRQWLTVSLNGEDHAIPLFYSDYRAKHFEVPVDENAQTNDDSASLLGAGLAHPVQVLLPANSELVLTPQQGEVIVSMKAVTASTEMKWTQSPCYREARSTEHNITCTQLFYKAPAPSIQHLDFLKGDTRADAELKNTHFTVRDVTTLTHIQSLADEQGAVWAQKAEHFIKQLYDYEQSAPTQSLDKAQTVVSLPALQALLHAFPESEFKTRFSRRLNQNLAWQAMKSPLSSAGIKRFKTPRSSVLSPISEKGLVLLSGKLQAGERLPNGGSLLYQFNGKQKALNTASHPDSKSTTQVRFTLSHAEHIFDHLPPAQVSLLVDDVLVAQHSIQAGESVQQPLQLPSGKSNVTFAMHRTDARQKVSLVTEQKNAQGQWQTWHSEQNVNLHQVSQATPIQFHLPHTKWLRVDEFEQSRYVRSYYRVAKAGIFTWHPKPNRQRGYRFFALEPKTQPLPHWHGESLNAQTRNDELNKAVAHGSVAKGEEAEVLTAQNALAHTLAAFRPDLNPQTYTWSMSAIYDKGFEQTGDRLEQQDFRELRLQYNKVASNGDMYQQSQFAIKDHQDLANSYHARFAWESVREPDAFNWRADVGLHYQSGMTLGTEKEPSAWSVNYRLSHFHGYSINQRFFNNWRFFIQGVILDRRDNDNVYYSQVYSDYKADHQFGVGVVDRLRFKPTQDSELYLEGRLLSNDLDENLSLDQARLTASARLFYQGVAVEAQFNHRHFYADDDRNESLKQNTLNLKLDWMLIDIDDSWRMQFDIQRDLDEKETAWFISLSYGNHNRRGVTDSLPSALPFRRFRNRQFLESLNESLKE